MNRKILLGYMKKHPDARNPIKALIAEIESANWKSPEDIKARYCSASFLPDNMVIFNIGGNKYRLKAQIAFKTGIVFIKQIGTHKEYDRWS